MDVKIRHNLIEIEDCVPDRFIYSESSELIRLDSFSEQI